MEIEISSFYKSLTSQINLSTKIQTAMDDIINTCSSYRTDEWVAFRNLRYDRDTPTLIEALNKMAKQADVAGIYTGIFNPVVDDEPTSDMYVVGCTDCDVNDEECEWVFSHKEPSKHAVYLDSTVHADIYRTAYQDGKLGNNAEYPLCLAYTSLAVNRAAREIGYLKPIAAGFDSGDILLAYSP